MKIEFRVALTTEAEWILQEERTLVKENIKIKDVGAPMKTGQGLNSKFSTVVRHGGDLGL